MSQRTDAELGRLLMEVKAAIEAGQASELGPFECAVVRDAHKVKKEEKIHVQGSR